MSDYLRGLRLWHPGVLQAPNGASPEAVEVDQVPPAVISPDELQVNAQAFASDTMEAIEAFS